MRQSVAARRRVDRCTRSVGVHLGRRALRDGGAPPAPPPRPPQRHRRPRRPRPRRLRQPRRRPPRHRGGHDGSDAGPDRRGNSAAAANDLERQQRIRGVRRIRRRFRFTGSGVGSSCSLPGAGGASLGATAISGVGTVLVGPDGMTALHLQARRRHRQERLHRRLRLGVATARGNGGAGAAGRVRRQGDPDHSGRRIAAGRVRRQAALRLRRRLRRPATPTGQGSGGVWFVVTK